MLNQLQLCRFDSFEKLALEKSHSQTSDRQLWKISASAQWLNIRIKVYFVMMKYLIFNEKKKICSEGLYLFYESHELVTRLFMCDHIDIV